MPWLAQSPDLNPIENFGLSWAENWIVDQQMRTNCLKCLDGWNAFPVDLHTRIVNSVFEMCKCHKR